MAGEASAAGRSQAGFWSFILLGPPIGGILALYVAGAAPLTSQLLLSVLAPSYTIGLIPAVLTGWADRWLTRRGSSVSSRLLAAGVSGAASGFIPLGPLYASGLIQGTMPLLLCLVAAVTAMICLSVFLAAIRLFR